MHPQLRRFYGASMYLLLPVIYLLLTLLLAGCSFPGSNSSIHNSTPTTSYTGNKTPTAVEQTTKAGDRSTLSQSATSPTATATPASVPFKVIGVAFSVWPGDHQGVCRTNTFFTASVLINVLAHNTGGTVTYTWLRSDMSNITPSTVTFAAGTTSRIVTAIWSLSANQGNGSAYWVAFKTLSPEVLTTPRITYHHTCQS